MTKECLSMEELYLINQLGFKEAEIETIENRFFCRLNREDWESIELNDDVDLEEGEEIEDYENYLKLPSGRIAYFPEELMNKDIKAQID